MLYTLLQTVLLIMLTLTPLSTGEMELEASEGLPHPVTKALDPSKLPALAGANGMTWMLLLGVTEEGNRTTEMSLVMVAEL